MEAHLYLTIVQIRLTTRSVKLVPYGYEFEEASCNVGKLLNFLLSNK
jgi:hypothetical protein